MTLMRMASLRSDWPALRILLVHWLNGRRPFGDAVSSVCRSACDVPFPGEPRANFRRRDLEAELGTPGHFCGRCVARGRYWLHEPLGSQLERGTLDGRGPSPVAEAEGGAHCWEVLGGSRASAPLSAPPPLSSAQARLLGTELRAPAGSAFPPAASS